MKFKCDTCGKKVKENEARGNFNVFGGMPTQYPIIASFCLCIDCCDIVKHTLEDIIKKQK